MLDNTTPYQYLSSASPGQTHRLHPLGVGAGLELEEDGVGDAHGRR